MQFHHHRLNRQQELLTTEIENIIKDKNTLRRKFIAGRIIYQYLQ